MCWHSGNDSVRTNNNSKRSSIMSKRNYELTPCDYGFKVEAWDRYGKYVCVYEKTVGDASKFIVDYWDKADERKKADELMHKAILNCIELDKKSGILTRNRDNLD
tara:strand:- start:41 stop:355 length:315 start_codon:yes stop_codon:yes gene_type:complete